MVPLSELEYKVRSQTCNPTPYTLHPTPYTLHPEQAPRTKLEYTV